MSILLQKSFFSYQTTLASHKIGILSRDLWQALRQPKTRFRVVDIHLVTIIYAPEPESSDTISYEIWEAGKFTFMVTLPSSFFQH